MAWFLRYSLEESYGASWSPPSVGLTAEESLRLASPMGDYDLRFIHVPWDRCTDKLTVRDREAEQTHSRPTRPALTLYVLFSLEPSDLVERILKISLRKLVHK
jgi:hypothetical protein